MFAARRRSIELIADLRTMWSRYNRRKRDIVMISEKDRQRAERAFKKEERDLDGRKAMREYESEGLATRAKTERLKVLRLAHEAQAQADGPATNLTKRSSRAPRHTTAL